MKWVVGIIGRPPRLVMQVPEEDAVRQVQDGEVLFLSDAEPGRCVIGDDGVSLVPTPVPLDDLRRDRWLLARDYRDRIAAAGCMTPFGRVDSDPESRAKINGASTAAIASSAAGRHFAVDWTMEDNSVVTLDAEGMIAIGLAVMQHVAACQQVGTVIRDRIDAATSPIELDEIDVTAGYRDA